MKISKRTQATLGLLLLAGLAFTPQVTAARGPGAGGWNQAGGQTGFSRLLSTLPRQDLSTEEEVGLAKMREEEKLARDVYLALHETWHLPVFQNIAASEQRHMDAVKLLLDRYDRTDPSAGLERGVFTDTKLQDLYTTFVQQGKQSLRDALQVGATIEDLDLKDLYDLLESTDNQDIRLIYQNLAKGSRNHLRAFATQLSFQGVTYSAQFLSQEEVDAILSSPRERGRVDLNGKLVQSGQGRGRHGWHQGSNGCRRF